MANQKYCARAGVGQREPGATLSFIDKSNHERRLGGVRRIGTIRRATFRVTVSRTVPVMTRQHSTTDRKASKLVSCLASIMQLCTKSHKQHPECAMDLRSRRRTHVPLRARANAPCILAKRKLSNVQSSTESYARAYLPDKDIMDVALRDIIVRVARAKPSSLASQRTTESIHLLASFCEAA